MSDELSIPRRFLKNRILLFIASGLILIIGIGNPPVSRTQEARVLETARQMLHQPTEQWLIPELNGDVRLQKPPAPYWYTALGFQIFGENEFAGRLPTALLAWATLLIVYLTATEIFDHRIGVLASSMLLGGYLFARHSRLAETDLPATLFTTLAILSVVRAMRDRASLADFHLFAIATGMTILCKGGPAVFGVLFLFAACAIEKRWDLLVRFLRSGAIITLIAVAIPWFAYAIHHHGLQTFLHELRNTAEGGDHSGSSLQYIADLSWGAAPWSILLPFAIYHGVRRWRADHRVRLTLIWIACITLPLLINGNKQKHYLLPLLPALTTLAAWWAVESWKQVKLVTTGAVTLAVVMPLVVTLLIPRLAQNPSQKIAERVNASYRDADLRFFGDNFSPVLSFNMRKRIPIVEGDPLSLPDDTTLLAIGKQSRPIVEPPAPFALIDRFDEHEQTYVFFRRK